MPDKIEVRDNVAPALYQTGIGALLMPPIGAIMTLIAYFFLDVQWLKYSLGGAGVCIFLFGVIVLHITHRYWRSQNPNDEFRVFLDGMLHGHDFLKLLGDPSMSGLQTNESEKISIQSERSAPDKQSDPELQTHTQQQFEVNKQTELSEEPKSSVSENPVADNLRISVRGSSGSAKFVFPFLEQDKKHWIIKSLKAYANQYKELSERFKNQNPELFSGSNLTPGKLLAGHRVAIGVEIEFFIKNNLQGDIFPLVLNQLNRRGFQNYSEDVANDKSLELLEEMIRDLEAD